MPLPIRDMAGIHISISPHFKSYHDRFPLSRYCSSVAILKLAGIAVNKGFDMAATFSVETWMNLAALDDLAVDYCLSRAVQEHPDAGAVNAVFVQNAAPFLVPMLQPISLPAPVPTAVSAAASWKGAQPAVAAQPAHRGAAARVLPPPPPPAALPARPNLETLHPCVIRVVCALAGKQGKSVFAVLEQHVGRLHALPVPYACKALREIGSKMTGATMPEQERIVDAVLAKFDKYRVRDGRSRSPPTM
jgi:hypothetical protein